MEKNKVTVTINGSEYIIRGEESDEEMRVIAAYVDSKIKELSSHNIKLNPTFASVLSALNIANELFQLRKQYDELKGKVEDPLKQLTSLKTEHGVLVEENSKLTESTALFSKEIEKKDAELSALNEKYEKLYKEYAIKNEELSNSYREYELMRREKENKQKEFERVRVELSESKHKLIELQNQLLQNQIDIVKLKKEFDEYKLNYKGNKEAESV
ncbi:cell division protein ZapA [Oxobacter pfennigii]|uniref:Cell division protein ZapA n=1 Tax=Oxobacter pfennigii TaxID=36849 RepID=A0A0P8X625_9CLOT|nr:cell division protein ZapA [Oxobacter pfennigii]KPU46377.1 cell division protein ZapA [Oxobacter pfennigii]